MALYNSTNGPGWTNSTNWLTSNSAWYGVTVTRGHVTGLALGSNQLSGTIPPQIGSLTYLTDLVLSANQLSGSIPPELGNLTELVNLDLHSNVLAGEIPSSIVNLYNLQFGQGGDVW